MTPDPNRMFIPEMNPRNCPCRGGWFLSDYDTWHRCDLHGRGMPHPEDDGAGWTREQNEQHWLGLFREAYRYFQDQSRLPPQAFRKLVEAHLQDSSQATPSQWVDAADTVADIQWRKTADREAMEQGFSCRLEAAMDAEAAVEAGARARNMEPGMYAPHGSPERAQADRWYR